MSTRYNWTRQAVTSSWNIDRVTNWYANSAPNGLLGNTVVGYCCSQMDDVVDSNNVVIGWKAAGNIKTLYYGEFIDVYDYRGFVRSLDTVDTYAWQGGGAGYWFGINAYVQGNNKATSVDVRSAAVADSSKLSFDVYELYYTGRGTATLLTSTNATEYPTSTSGTKVNNYWYVYKGTDNPDPTSISYKTSDVEVPGNITISIVAPTVSSSYSPVKYVYQYSINNGTWTTFTTTTDKSVTYYIPEGTENICFRVRAKDDTGWTSTTYVTGTRITLDTLKAYVGVNGSSRKVDKMYVGVGGVAKQVSKVYVGINGTSRRVM